MKKNEKEQNTKKLQKYINFASTTALSTGQYGHFNLG